MILSKNYQKIKNPIIFLVIGFLIFLEILGFKNDFNAPIKSFIVDIFKPPKSGTIIWFGFILSLVFFPKKLRIRALLIATVLDILFLILWMIFFKHASFGNGALIVLIGLLFQKFILKEEYSKKTINGVLIGLLFILANKIADSWLMITAIYRPNVLDEYVAYVDNIFFQPSWRIGQFLNSIPNFVSEILNFIYVQLPLAAIIIAVYQIIKNVKTTSIIKPFLLVGILGPLFYLIFPVVGPVYFFSSVGDGFEVADIWPNILPIIENPTSITFDRITPRNCMPSLHTAWAIIILIHGLRGNIYLKFLGIFWFISTIISTLGFGYHYGADLYAGVIFAVIIESIFLVHINNNNKIFFIIINSLILLSVLIFYRYETSLANEYPIIFRIIFGSVLLGLISYFIKLNIINTKITNKV